MKLKTLFVVLISLALRVNAQESFIHHEISANVEPSTSYIDVVDTITFPADKISKDLKFTLNNVLSVSSLSPGIEIKKTQESINSEDIGMDREESETSKGVPLNEYQIIFPGEISGEINIQLKYSGKIESPIEQSQENYARGFSESPGIISDSGIYLARRISI